MKRAGKRIAVRLLMSLLRTMVISENDDSHHSRYHLQNNKTLALLLVIVAFTILEEQ